MEPETKQITLSIGLCPKCGKPHDEVKAVVKPGDKGATHEAECPDKGERFPVWHSGTGG